ncbi:MAG TPA: TonB-dependent receptor, partial [Opitutaceae bacterium]
ISQAVAAGPGVLSLRAGDFTTNGSVLIAPAERGPVDIAAASRHNLEEAAWRGSLAGGVSLVATLRRYDEWRDNGTAYQQNSFRQLFGSLALSGKIQADATWSLTGYAIGQQSSQTFSSVNAARTAETPASNQFAVPATAVGSAASATWKDSSGTVTTVGLDVRDVAGETREDYTYAAGSYADQRFAGGRQLFAGAFAEQSRILAPGLRASAGVRLDRWENSDGHLRNVAATSGALLLQNLFPARAGTEFSPSAGLNWKASGSLELHLTAQHAFREPTLNELYRPFRQGTTTTLANAALETEHADTAELGAAWRTGRLTVTSALFAARLENPVSNVTLAQGPGTFPLFGTLPAGSVGQERLNLGRVDTQGVEAGAHWLAGGGFTLDASVIDEEAQVASAPVSPALVGRTVPEVPRWSAALGATWSWRRFSASARVRWTGSQFDDDQNQLPLASAAVADVAARFEATAHAEIFATVDNLGNAEVETAHSALGVFSVAPPRTAEVGARLSW